MEFKRDNLGGEIGRDYSTILTDPTFEKRLQSFDKNLKLMFDQRNKRWRILEWAPDGSGWNLLMTAEDDEGNAKPLGEWVFNKLYVWRHNAEQRNKDPQKFYTQLLTMGDEQRNQIQRQSSLNHQYKLIDERNEWRRAWREWKNLPKSDVTAGFPKIQHKPKGVLICP